MPLAPKHFGRFLIATLTATLSVSIAFAQVEGLDEPVDEDEELNFISDDSVPKLDFREPWQSAVFVMDQNTGELETLALGGAAVTGDNGLEIFVFDLGQADSTLVIGPGPERKTLLIDLGKSKSPGKGKSWTYEHVGQRIYDLTGSFAVDYVLISHFHSDHLGSGDYGFLGLMDKSTPSFKVGSLIDTGILGGRFLSTRNRDKRAGFSSRVQTWLDSGQLSERAVPQFGNQQIDLGTGVTVEIMTFAGLTHAGHDGVHADYESNHPGHYDAKGANENDLSIGVKISRGDFEFWTAGDLSGAGGHGRNPLSGSGNAYTNVEWPLVQQMQAAGVESNVEIYRANHHGSKHSTSWPLLEALNPEFVLYSSGEANYNHPAVSVVKKVQQTARQYATSMDVDAWPDVTDFAKYKGTKADEIHIMVSNDGSLYSIEGRIHESFSDTEEAAGADIGAEDRPVENAQLTGALTDTYTASGWAITPNVSTAEAKAFYELVTGQAPEYLR